MGVTTMTASVAPANRPAGGVGVFVSPGGSEKKRWYLPIKIRPGFVFPLSSAKNPLYAGVVYAYQRTVFMAGSWFEVLTLKTSEPDGHLWDDSTRDRTQTLVQPQWSLASYYLLCSRQETQRFQLDAW